MTNFEKSTQTKIGTIFHVQPKKAMAIKAWLDEQAIAYRFNVADTSGRTAFSFFDEEDYNRFVAHIRS